VGTRAESLRTSGSLRDVAPTVLSMLGLEMPSEMTGQSLMETR
jgi:2,3-bisphosphoglycerate-independent phosphoglycerate mutase